jgi:hypothetical protein
MPLRLCTLSRYINLHHTYLIYIRIIQPFGCIGCSKTGVNTWTLSVSTRSNKVHIFVENNATGTRELPVLLTCYLFLTSFTRCFVTGNTTCLRGQSSVSDNNIGYHDLPTVKKKVTIHNKMYSI